MDIRHLRHFLAVVESGSFHAAAQELNLTQQAISRSIKNLETELGVRLLERRARDRRKVSPTEFGRLLLPHAISVAKDLQNLKAQFDNLLGMRHTLVRFAATPTAMSRLVAPALPAFRSRRPKFRLQAMQMVLPSIITRLADGAFDFVVADEPQDPLTDQYVVEPLLTDHSALVCGSRHPLAKAGKDALMTEDLGKQRWIGFGPFVPTMIGFKSILGHSDADLPTRQVETSSFDLVLSELRTNKYLSVIPRELARPFLDSGELIELPMELEPAGGWRISIIRRADDQLSPAAEDLLDCIRASARESREPESQPSSPARNRT